MENPDISVIIPAHNAASTIGDTIEACLNQDYPRDKTEIIVVDDGSGDNIRELLGRSPVKYIYQERKGPAAARNTGWMASRGQALCFIDADCVPHRDWLSRLTKNLYRDNVVAIAGSYSVDGCRYLLDKFVHHEIRYRHTMMSEYTNSFGTYNVLIKRAQFQRLGGFDIGYYSASGEDSDLAYRIVKAGYRIYFEKDALVEHRNILRLWKYIKTQFRHGYWRMKLYKSQSPIIFKDKYAYWKDYIEVVLALAIIISLPVALLRANFLTTIVFGSALFLIQLPLAIRTFLSEKDVRYLLFSFVTFARAFSRIIGGIIGFISFWIMG